MMRDTLEIQATHRRSGLKFFSGFETNCFAGRNIGYFPCTRITTDSAFARFDHKDTKAAQLYAFAALHGRLHALEQSFNRYFGFGLGDTCLLCYLIDYVELYHFSPPINSEDSEPQSYCFERLSL